ncbi:slipin family protein [Candidatus Woesearchaeota archaeon]|nr:slipin family protein [Candidatus Woesearchaeota archaeon]
MVLGWLIGLGVAFIVLFLKVIYEYDRGVLFTLGKFSRIVQPGLRVVIPIIQKMVRVDLRTRVIDVPDQDCITKDNVSVNVNAVLYFKVLHAEKAIIKVEHFMYALSQLAQTTMRDVVGEVSLDELLSKRDQLSNRIQQLVDHATDPWGIKVQSVDIKHIELPKSLKRTMAKEAEAERERRAVIIKAEGEVTASDNVSKAASILTSAKGAMHLRTLQTLNDTSSDPTNTIVFAVPLEVINAVEESGKKGGWKR